MSRGDEFRPSKRFSTERLADDGLPIYSPDELDQHHETYLEKMVYSPNEGIKFTELKPCYVEYPKSGRFYKHEIDVGLEKEFKAIGQDPINITAKPVSKLQPRADEGLGILEANIRSPQETAGYLIELSSMSTDPPQIMVVIINQTNLATIKQILLTMAQTFITNKGTLKELWETALQPLRGEITYKEDLSI